MKLVACRSIARGRMLAAAFSLLCLLLTGGSCQAQNTKSSSPSHMLEKRRSYATGNKSPVSGYANSSQNSSGSSYISGPSAGGATNNPGYATSSNGFTGRSYARTSNAVGPQRININRSGGLLSIMRSAPSNSSRPAGLSSTLKLKSTPSVYHPVQEFIRPKSGSNPGGATAGSQKSSGSAKAAQSTSTGSSVLSRLRKKSAPTSMPEGLQSSGSFH
jgi:hypothetical protein